MKQAGLASGHISTEKYLSRVASTTGVEKFKPTIPVSVRKRKPKTPSATVTSTSITKDVDDEELCAFADQVEENLVQPTSEPNISQQPTPDASQSIQAPELEEPVPLVPEVIEMPEAQPEQVLTASVALPSSVRNEGKLDFGLYIQTGMVQLKMDLKWSELDCSNGDLSTRSFIFDCNSDDETLLR
ncbi:hypothetical protein pdam_00019522 [Pocillopora damicornis]|uniref:Uncharacterized protein n=1 Tax=Pocillopora damicornis TaxID=46731 RepID=A0A3M6TCH3_POCDA|nr:hypothetical protein pdam_00019522 [Pocillopora damicornis]